MTVQPIVFDYLSQIFTKHYSMDQEAAEEAALKFVDILELYQMQLVIGEWLVPERAEPLTPKNAWDRLAETMLDIEESGREPWLAREIQ